VRLVFMGTPEFAVPTLDLLVESGHDVASVYTRPDNRSGRGRKIISPPVKKRADFHGIPVVQPETFRTKVSFEHLMSLEAETAVIAAYGVLLPLQIIEGLPLGCLNIHPSLLPKHRGASPVATSILQGEDITGVTVMLLDKGLDTGPVLAQEKVSIGADEKCGELTGRLFRKGASLLLTTLDLWKSGDIDPNPQDDLKATTTKRLSREDGKIDWQDSSTSILRSIRAFHPWPGTFTYMNGRPLKILEALQVYEKQTLVLEPGQVHIGNEILVGTGEGNISLKTIQAEGKKAVSATEFSLGRRDLEGMLLGI